MGDMSGPVLAALLFVQCICKLDAFGGCINPSISAFRRTTVVVASSQAEITNLAGSPTELPDSLDDAAQLGAEATIRFASTAGNVNARCRVDFDTSMGDETFTTLKSSTEFMQKFTTALSYGMISGLQQYKQDQMMWVVQAKADLNALLEEEEKQSVVVEANAEDEAQGPSKQKESPAKESKMKELQEMIQSGGMTEKWTGEKVRIYFPDEGNAALAQRDWRAGELVPPCVEFSSLGGVQVADTSKDAVVLFFCPRAAESGNVEDTLYAYEERGIKLSVFVNPLLVDMGVTGFGMAGRMLRERLLDGLQNTYYLRTLQWGALTRSWPRDFTVWQEDEAAEGGYRMIAQQTRLPSNPEVEDIYDIENGLQNANQEGFGVLNALGDFVQGMMRL